MTYKISPWTPPTDAEIIKAAENLYDNRLGWSEGRNPYAPQELWTALGLALGRNPLCETPHELTSRPMPTRLELEEHYHKMGSTMVKPGDSVADVLTKITDVIRDVKISDIVKEEAAPVSRAEFEALALEVAYLTRLLDTGRIKR
jgi:hypothetical protein